MSRIAFVSNRDGNWDIYVMNADGSQKRNLTNHPSFDSYPSWSPDGTKLVFYSDRDGDREVYVMNADGSNQTRLTNDAAADHSPAWSPDGSRIAFVSDRSGRTNVWIMDADGSNPVNLMPELKTTRWPVWSPDGSQIAFVWASGLFVIGPDGLEFTRIISVRGLSLDRLFVGWPDWSPDGSKLALISDLLDENQTGVAGTLYTVDRDGRPFRPVLSKSTAGPDESPSWSPNGRLIAYASYAESGERDIWVVDVDTGYATRLTTNEAMDSFPAWEPTGYVPEGLVASASPTPATP
jgi:Tol biopolymer transport system component